MTNIEYFYIRALREDGSMHRVGLIGLGTLDGCDSIFISGSFCSVDDQFDSTKAVNILYGRIYDINNTKCFKVPNCDILKKVYIYKILDRLNFYQPVCKQGVNFVDIEDTWVSFREFFISKPKESE